MIQGRRAALVQDEFQIPRPCEMAWGMTTDAEVDVTQGAVAVLRLKGKELTARLLSPKDAVFTVEAAEQQPPQEKNTGVRRLMVRLPKVEGAVRVIVLLSPMWPDGKVVETAEIKPLANW